MNLHKTIVKIVPFTYFARNDFYESKILKILTLPRSLDYELIVKFHKSKGCREILSSNLCNNNSNHQKQRD